MQFSGSFRENLLLGSFGIHLLIANLPQDFVVESCARNLLAQRAAVEEPKEPRVCGWISAAGFIA